MRQLKFICVQPDDTYYLWQVHAWLESLRQIGQSDKAIVLVFTPTFREPNTNWKNVEALYPESEFFYLKDEDDITKLIQIYIPILRPYTLMKYFKAHPERKNDAIMYCDCDILFTQNFNVDKYINDDVCYVSDTNSYINASYFDSKIRDVIPEKLEEYKTIDVLAEVTATVGVSREICEANNMHSGGAQYLLKNVDDKFWEKVLTDAINIYLYLGGINRAFFENENRGFQRWCADMWAVLWNIWVRGMESKVVKEMDFAWTTDHINRLEQCGIFHNAGATGESMGETPMFYKGKYHAGLLPFDDNLEAIVNNEKNKAMCNNYYVQKLIDLKQKYYNLKYN
jgi:hypothetical protein